MEKTEQINIRVTKSDRKLIEKAAMKTRRNISNFIMNAALDKAEQILNKHITRLN